MSSTLALNGTPRAVEADGNTPLLLVLRGECALSGPKFGCGAGECGACMVLLDGRAVPSCDLPLWACENKAVTTLEGLGRPDAPHALQRAFLHEQAGQCGYCLNGMLVAAAALLAHNPAPSRDEICAALERNLCRCGSHNRIIRAVERAAAELRAAAAPGGAHG